MHFNINLCAMPVPFFCLQYHYDVKCSKISRCITYFTFYMFIIIVIIVAAVNSTKQYCTFHTHTKNTSAYVTLLQGAKYMFIYIYEYVFGIGSCSVQEASSPDRAR